MSQNLSSAAVVIDALRVNEGQKYCRMLQESILQYFWPSFSYHMSLTNFEWPFKTGFTVQSRELLP